MPSREKGRMKVRDFVVPIQNPDAVPAKVLKIEDLGHGKGFERVKISLRGFVRCYAKNELQKVVVLPDKENIDE